MAENTNVNKVVYGNDTLIDLTQDTVEASNLLEGETAHDRSGAPVTGTAKQGHILKNQAGTAMTQRANMKFKDAGLSDNSNGAATEVEIIHQVTKSQLDALGQNTDGIYETTDEDDEPWADVSDDYVEVTADGVKTYGQLLNELYDLVDYSKLNENSYLMRSISSIVYRYSTNTANTVKFFYVSGGSDYYDLNSIILGKTLAESLYIGYSTNESGTAISNVTSNVAPNNLKITLYYGTKSSIIELNTDAQHCIMSDGQNLEQVYQERITSGAGNDISIELYKYGKVVYFIFGNGEFTASAGDALATIPSGFIPISQVDFRDTYSNKRIKINSTNGNITCNEALSSTIIRGTGSYITK